VDHNEVTPDVSPGGARAPETPAPRPGALGSEAENGAGTQAGRLRHQLLSGPTRLLLPLALAIIVLYGMKYASSILNPVFLALFLTMGMSPALYWMRRRGVPPWLCVLIITVITVILVVLFVLVLLNAATQLTDKLPTYQDRLGSITSSLQAWLAKNGVDTGGLTHSIFSAERILGTTKSLVSSLAGAVGNVFWLVLIFIFMVAEAYSIPTKMGHIHMDARFAASFANFSRVTRSFLFTKGWLSAVMGVFCTAIYYAFGVDFALVWGMLFFLLSFVPNLGFILSVVPPFFITLLEFSFTRAIVVVVCVVVANAIVDNLVSPRIMGEAVGLSTLTVFLSVFFWGWVLGGLGALMSVPLTLMVKLLFFDSFDSTRTISAIMSAPVRDLGRRRKNNEGGEAPAPGAAV
jgi:AI-2 transport protein TqsA